MKNCIDDLDNQQKKINTITTDRHPQIKSYIIKDRKNVDLQFDIWHVGKNIKKILSKKAKKKDSAILNG